MKIKVSDYIIKFLESKNIDTVFTVSGGGSIALCDSLYRSKMRYICNHHEQASVFAAESYARAKNKVGCALVTTGPGGTNALTGIASAWIDSVPLFVISGQVYYNQTIKKSGLRQLGVQEIDIVTLAKSITKYSKIITNVDQIKDSIEKAYHLSTSGRPGPVLIDIPADIQNSIIDSKMPKIIKTNKNDNFKIEYKKIIKYINDSKRPLFIFGQGAKISNAQNEIKKILKKTRIPFALTWNASDLIESSHELYVGRPGAFAERGANFVIQNCDLLISIGTRLPFMVTGYNYDNFAKNAKKIFVDIDQQEIKNHHIKFDIKVCCDAKKFIKNLNNLDGKKLNIHPLWNRYCRDIKKDFPIVLPEYKKQKKFVNSYYFTDLLSKKLDSNSVIVTDMGLSFVGTHQSFNVKKNQKLYTNSGHAPMGWGLPASIGAFYADTTKNVICLTGDGGLQMNIQELATIMQWQIPIKIFIYNNKGYLTIKQTQQLGFGGRLMGSDKKSGISFPNYSQIAKAHKIKFVKINNHTELKKKLPLIINYLKPVICELNMDCEQEQIPKMINKRDGFGKTIPTDFDDLYPYLEKKKIENCSFDQYIKKNE